MTKNAHCIIGLVFAIVLLAPTMPVDAQRTHLGVPASQMVAIGGAVARGGELDLRYFNTGEVFVVPANKAFVLTDITMEPQYFPPPATQGVYRIQVLPSPVSTPMTALTMRCSDTDPSSFVLNLTAGMVFPSRSRVRASLAPQSSVSVALCVYGYLVAEE